MAQVELRCSPQYRAVLPQNKKPSTFKNVVDCALDQYGFGDDDNAGDAAAGVGRAASEILASPVPKEDAGFYRHPRSSFVTNVLNALSVKTRVGSRLFFSGSAADVQYLIQERESSDGGWTGERCHRSNFRRLRCRKHRVLRLQKGEINA